jgi:hypothetical protein
MTPRDQARDDLARLRAEATAYASRAAYWRKEAIELKKQRRWLDALKADVLAGEYRQTRDKFAADAKAIRERWGLR